MVSFVALLKVAFAIQVVLGSPIWTRTPYEVKESHRVPQAWTKLGRAPSHHKIQLQIALKQGSFDELERHLYEVSDPEHERYGKHLSIEEVKNLVRPKAETLDLVEEWLKASGVGLLSYSSANDWIMAIVTVTEAERLLDTKYYIFEHKDGTQLLRTDTWSLPAHLHCHIDTIQPTTSFFRGAAHSNDIADIAPWTSPTYKTPSDSIISKVCNISSVTPECFMNLYSIKGYKTQVPEKNCIGFNNFLEEVPIRPDTAQFLSKYRPDAVPGATAFPQISIDKGPIQDGPLTPAQANNGICREANLDVQTILGISYPTTLISYSTGGRPKFIPDLNTPTNTNEPYLTWVNYMTDLSDVPYVISTSYGDDEQTVPQPYAERVCQQFAQLGARGVSLLFSSGDSGVGANNTCISNDGKNTTKFIPSFPASCPFVTTVGATHEFEPEVVAYRPSSVGADGVVRDAYASGAGFSDYFPRPEYQNETVVGYLGKLNGLYDGLYNDCGRAYPDISAQGQYFAWVWNGTESVISGTSASTPLMSSVIALVNDALIAKGRPVLGFLNPWLYSKGWRAFTDITNGSAVGCKDGISGFPATEGWDAVTGFGTPVFPMLVDLAMESGNE